jgi:hypothetical protein
MILHVLDDLIEPTHFANDDVGGAAFVGDVHGVYATVALSRNPRNERAYVRMVFLGISVPSMLQLRLSY